MHYQMRPQGSLDTKYCLDGIHLFASLPLLAKCRDLGYQRLEKKSEKIQERVICDQTYKLCRSHTFHTISKV